MFPHMLYKDSGRRKHVFEKRVSEVLQKKIISPTDHINIIQIRPDIKSTPYGQEYRFFLEKKGIITDKVSQYNSSKTLLIFSEIPNYDITQINSWETQQYGLQYLKKSQIYHLSDITVYKVSK